MFSDFDLIYRYSRAQALAEGVLVDVSELATEVGFRCPVAFTHALYAALEGGETTQRWILATLLESKRAARRQSARSEVRFTIPQRGHASETCPLKMVIAPGDSGEAVITLMLAHED